MGARYLLLGAAAGLLLAASLRANVLPGNGAAQLGRPVERTDDAALVVPPGLLFGTPYPTDEFRPADDDLPGPRLPAHGALFSPLDAFRPVATLGWPYAIQEPRAHPEPAQVAPTPRPEPLAAFDAPANTEADAPLAAAFGDAATIGDPLPLLPAHGTTFSVLDEFRPALAFGWPYPVYEPGARSSVPQVAAAPRPRPAAEFEPPVVVESAPPLVVVFGDAYPAREFTPPPIIRAPRPRRATLGDPVPPAVEIVRVTAPLPRITSRPTLGAPEPSAVEVIWLQPPDVVN